jgi:hypothetical protein
MEKHYKRWLVVSLSIAFLVLATRRLEADPIRN